MKAKKVLLVVTVITVILMIMSLIMPDRIKKIIKKEGSENSKAPSENITLEAIYSREIIGDMKVFLKDGSLYYFSDGTLIKTGFSNEVQKRVDFDYKEPNIQFKDSYMYVSDKDKSEIRVISYDDLNVVKKMEYKENLMFINEDDKNLFVQLNDGMNDIMRVYDKNLNERFRIISKYPILCCDVEDNMSSLKIASYDIKDGSYPNSQLRSVDRKGRSELIHKFNNEIICFLKDLGRDTVVATNKGIYFMSDGKEVWKDEYSLLKDIRVLKDRIYCLNEDALKVYDFSGKVLKNIEFRHSVRKMERYFSSFAVFSDSDIYVPENSSEYCDIRIDFRAKEVYISGDYILFRSNQDIKLFKLNKK